MRALFKTICLAGLCLMPMLTVIPLQADEQTIPPAQLWQGVERSDGRISRLAWADHVEWFKNSDEESSFVLERIRLYRVPPQAAWQDRISQISEDQLESFVVEHGFPGIRASQARLTLGADITQASLRLEDLKEAVFDGQIVISSLTDDGQQGRLVMQEATLKGQGLEAQGHVEGQGPHFYFQGQGLQAELKSLVFKSFFDNFSSLTIQKQAIFAFDQSHHQSRSDLEWVLLRSVGPCHLEQDQKRDQSMFLRMEEQVSLLTKIGEEEFRSSPWGEIAIPAEYLLTGDRLDGSFQWQAERMQQGVFQLSGKVKVLAGDTVLQGDKVNWNAEDSELTMSAADRLNGQWQDINLKTQTLQADTEKERMVLRGPGSIEFEGPARRRVRP